MVKKKKLIPCYGIAVLTIDTNAIQIECFTFYYLISLNGMRFYMIFITTCTAVWFEERREVQGGIMDSTFQGPNYQVSAIKAQIL